jgi:hypothetical protein
VLLTCTITVTTPKITAVRRSTLLVTKSCTLDRIQVRADDENGVSDAGLLVPATLGDRLGLGPLLREHLTVPGSAGANPDRKCLTVIHSLLAGGDCIEDVNALRARSTGAVLGHRVAASSTVGTFLRAFGFGHARQLDAVTRRLLARAVAAGAHPRFGQSVTVDIDSTLCETYGLGKDGARGVMRTGLRGYHPLLAVIAGTPEIAGVVAHARLRRGRSSDSTSAPVFIKETINRLRQAGAAGEIVLRADSGFPVPRDPSARRAIRQIDQAVAVSRLLLRTALLQGSLHFALRRKVEDRFARPDGSGAAQELGLLFAARRVPRRKQQRPVPIEQEHLRHQRVVAADLAQRGRVDVRERQRARQLPLDLDGGARDRSRELAQSIVEQRAELARGDRLAILGGLAREVRERSQRKQDQRQEQEDETTSHQYDCCVDFSCALFFILLRCAFQSSFFSLPASSRLELP